MGAPSSEHERSYYVHRVLLLRALESYYYVQGHSDYVH